MGVKRDANTAYLDIRVRISEDQLPECYAWYKAMPSRQRQKTLRSILVQAAQLSSAVSGAPAPPATVDQRAVQITQQPPLPRQNVELMPASTNGPIASRDTAASATSPKTPKPVAGQKTVETGSTNPLAGDATRNQSFDSFADELLLNI